MKDFHHLIEQAMIVNSIKVVSDDIGWEFVIFMIYAEVSIGRIRKDCFESRDKRNVGEFGSRGLFQVIKKSGLLAEGTDVKIYVLTSICNA
jgi:hypothetical protein